MNHMMSGVQLDYINKSGISLELLCMMGMHGYEHIIMHRMKCDMSYINENEGKTSISSRVN